VGRDRFSCSVFCGESWDMCLGAPFSSSSVPARLVGAHGTSQDYLSCLCFFVWSSISGLFCMCVSALGVATTSTTAYDAGRVCVRALIGPCRAGHSWNMCPAFPQP
jgi:hypothetical protein